MNQVDLEAIYTHVLKNGKHALNNSVNRGEMGYLPSLDGIIQVGDTLSEVNLGVVEIPLTKIIGTYTHSRSISFASNFMPLMDVKTEFANKWMNLYNAHVNEGLRDPIKVYEYLNRFFVVEGNKRISVLKYVGATSYNAEVIRIVPKRDPEDKLNTIYYEFMNFYKVTRINSIWFSQEGSFEKLLEYLQNYSVDDFFAEDIYRVFLANTYRPFRRIYHQEGGSNLNITTGDAFLTFIQIHGLPQEITEAEHTKNISQLIEELGGIESSEANVKTELTETPKRKNMLTTFTGFIHSKKTLKIAFVYAKAPEKSGWAYSHELGRLHINNIFNTQIETTKIVDVPENHEAYYTFKLLAQQMYDVVFTTSPTFVAPALKAAMEYPYTKFFNCAATHSYKSLTSYSGRIHEARYLLGMLAGAMTKTNTIGYVAPYPISEVVSSINAFTLGAQAVNPQVCVKTMWTHKWDHPEQGKNVAQKLSKLNADIISNQDLPIPGEASKEYGIYSIIDNGNGKQHYAMVIWNWGIFYEKVIKNILSGTWKDVTEVNATANMPMNFWLGMDTGIVDLLYSNRNVPPQMKRLIELVRNAIITKEFEIFKGPIYNQDNQLHVPNGKSCSYEEIINMNWLVKGVDGIIPDIKDLSPTDPLSYMQNITK